MCASRCLTGAKEELRLGRVRSPNNDQTQTSGRIQKIRSTLRLCSLHHRSIRVQNLGIYLLDPPRSLGNRSDGTDDGFLNPSS